MRAGARFFVFPVLLFFLFQNWGMGTVPAASLIPLQEGANDQQGAVIGETALPGLTVQEPVLFFPHGHACVVGEIANDGTRAAAWIKVEAVFQNQLGEVLGRKYTYIKHLNQGERKPYRLLLPEEEAVERVEVIIVSAHPAQEKAVPLAGRVVQISRGKGGFLHITGTVTNSGAGELDLVKVILKFIGEEGELVEIASHYLQELQPGEEREFTCYSEEREGWREVEMVFD